MQVLSNNCSLFFNIAKQLFYFKNGRFWRLFGLGGSWALGEAWTPTPKSDVRCPMSGTESDARQPGNWLRYRTIVQFSPVPREIPLMQAGSRQLGWAESEQSQKSGLIF